MEVLPEAVIVRFIDEGGKPKVTVTDTGRFTQLVVLSQLIVAHIGEKIFVPRKLKWLLPCAEERQYPEL